MTQQGYRHRIIIQDRSGSMDAILEGAQAGLDEFIAGEAKAPGKVTLSLWDFDTETRCVHTFGKPEALRGYQILPRGGTNMYDAVWAAVTNEGHVLAELAEDERPEDVTVLIASDGQHNTTVLHGGTEVKELLEQQQGAYKWRVLYMGCGQDAFREGGKIGAQHGLTVNSVASSAGQQNAWKMSSNYLRRAPVGQAAMAAGLYDLNAEERALGESAEGDDTAGK
jgi:hypothetical protein